MQAETADRLNVNPAFSMAGFKAAPKEWRERIPESVKDYVSLGRFMEGTKMKQYRLQSKL